MIKNIKQISAFLLSLSAISLLFTSISVVAAEGDEQEKIRNSLAILLPSVEPDSIVETPVPGLFEITFGPRLIYMSSDGRYLVQGEMVDLETRENLTEPRVRAAKVKAVNEVGEQNMLIFSPEKPKYTISVFTDIDCGYCRLMHSKMDEYNNAGIKVRYLFFPRTGLGSESYNKAVSVWCSEDRHKAITTAKAQQPIENKTCESPVQGHYLLGQLLGVQGTPTIVMESGEIIPGYLPPETLIKKLAQAEAAKDKP